jgi:hypothetical protein
MDNPITLDIESEIASFYAPYLLESLKYGENRICIWFPGSGKSTIVDNIIRNKKILFGYLGGMSSNFEFIKVSGKDTTEGNLEEVLVTLAQNLSKTNVKISDDYKYTIADVSRKIIDNGKEVVFVGDELELLPKEELSKLLIFLSSVVSINKARIHTILNVKPVSEFQNILINKGGIYNLSNDIVIVPILQGKLLQKFIHDQNLKFNSNLSEKREKVLEKYTGGLLLLTKELIRNNSKQNQLDHKLQAIWSRVPEEYRELLLDSSKNNFGKLRKSEAELKKFGVLNIKVFMNNLQLLLENKKILLDKYLNTTEKDIYSLLAKNKRRLIKKENIAKVIWGQNYAEKYSDWAVDQVISRFRKKISKAGIDPKSLSTIKGKGYKWLN